MICIYIVVIKKNYHLRRVFLDAPTHVVASKLRYAFIASNFDFDTVIYTTLNFPDQISAAVGCGSVSIQLSSLSV